MQTLWKLSQDGNSASRTLDNGSSESRLVIAIPADELATALPADPVPPPTPQELIANLESTTTQRMIREAALGTDNNRLKAIESQIDAIRATMK